MWGVLHFIALILGFPSSSLALFLERACTSSPHSPEKINTETVKVKAVLVSKWRYTPLLLLNINHCQWISMLKLIFLLCLYVAFWRFFWVWELLLTLYLYVVDQHLVRYTNSKNNSRSTRIKATFRQSIGVGRWMVIRSGSESGRSWPTLAQYPTFLTEKWRRELQPLGHLLIFCLRINTALHVWGLGGLEVKLHAF